MCFEYKVIKTSYLVVIYAVLSILFSSILHAQEIDWPRDLTLDSGVLTIYQPQVDDMEKDILQFRAAVSYKATGSDEPVFGAAWFESRAETDREERTVTLVSLKVTDTRFPEGSENVRAEFEQAIKVGLPEWDLTFSLDDLLTSLEASEEQIAAANDLNMDPPDIIYRDHPALLVMIDGEPVLREVENSPYKAVINTPYPLILDTKTNTYYLNAAKDVWYQSKAATGAYAYLSNPPSDIAGMVDQSEMEDSDEAVTAATAPEIIIRTEPTELIVTEGPADFKPLVDDLLVITNSASDVFMHVSDQDFYIVLSGRWFQSSSMEGPWVYVDSDALPAAFQAIPEDSNQADSRVYVAGTDEAREAVMDAQIPQTAAVSRGRVEIEVTYDGDPKFAAITGSNLKYAINTSSTVLESGKQYYLVEDAVWYVGPSPAGPWDVADSRPGEVDSIPPESPVYNVKYVYIYDTTPEVVYVGYTPGYVGSYVYRTTIVYGTGWYYRPWVSPRYYYPYQATWGFHVAYNPWTGWGFGLSWGWGPFRIGYHTGGYWHRHHYWHHRHYGRWGAGGYRPRPVHYGNNNIRINNININSPRVSLRDNNLYRDRDQRAKVRQTHDLPMNRDTRDRMAGKGPGAAGDKVANMSISDKRNNVFTDKQGNVYRKNDNGWQKRESGGWKDTSAAAGGGVSKPSTRPAQPSTGGTGNKATRPATGSAVSRPAQSQQPTISARQTPTYKSSNSGYNRPSGLDRQSYSRERSSSRNYQHSQQRSTQARSRTGGNRRR